MKRLAVLATAVLVPLLVVAGATAVIGHKQEVRANLDGYFEVPANSTTGSGSFHAQIESDKINYELRYADLEAPAAQAHIHFAQRDVNGGIAAFLCGGGGKPVCPGTAGTVTGTIVPADVIGPAVQGIAAGEFAELVRAIRAGRTYANVHSSKFPAGEIRGQLNDHGRGDRKHDEDD